MCDMHKEKINVCKDFVGSSEEKRQLEGLGVYERIILRWILGGKKTERVWSLWMGQVAGFVATLMNHLLPYDVNTVFTT